MLAVAELDGNLAHRIVIEPQLLQVRQITYLGRQFHNIIEAEIEANQVGHGENLGQHLVQIHLRQVQSVRSLRLGHSCADLIVLSVRFVGGQKFVRAEVGLDHHVYLSLLYLEL